MCRLLYLFQYDFLILSFNRNNRTRIAPSFRHPEDQVVTYLLTLLIVNYSALSLSPARVKSLCFKLNSWRVLVFWRRRTENDVGIR